MCTLLGEALYVIVIQRLLQTQILIAEELQYLPGDSASPKFG
jgi:hypothetical protein